MPILTLQRSVHELGRIRLGTQRGTNKPGTPLETFRFTSQRDDLLQLLADKHGGAVVSWDGQYDLVTQAEVLDVLVPPEDVGFSQWLEHWTADGCQRRCDGYVEVLHDTACLCADESTITCKHTTRLNVLLPDLESFGTWRLETHSFYAAAELRSAVELALGLAARRGQHLAYGTLRIEQRTVKRAGEPPKHFSVPVLDVAMQPALSDPRAQAAFQNGPQALSLAASTDAPTHVARIDRGAETTPVTALPADDATPPTAPVVDAVKHQQRRMFARTNKLLPEATRDEVDSFRHALAVVATARGRARDGQPPAASWNDCTPAELATVEGLLMDVDRGAMIATPRDGGAWSFKLTSNGHVAHVHEVDDVWVYDVEV